MVSPATRARVLEAVRKSRYQPDLVARSLRIKQTSTLGLIVSDILNPFHAALARAIEEAAQRRGFTVVLGNTNEEENREQAYLDVLVASRVEGIILVPCATNSRGLQRVVEQGVPVVQVDRLTPNVSTDAVLLDNRLGARLAVEHLVSLGHRRIGFISGPQHLTTGVERLEGYRQTLAGAGLFYDPELIHLGNFREAAGYEGTRRLLALPDPPTAILTANNEMAAGAVRALAELRQAIGSDVSLITFDDARWAQYMVPPMTVVAQPVAEIGQTAVDILFRRLDREAASARPAVYTLQPYLIVRESTKPYQAKRK